MCECVQIIGNVNKGNYCLKCHKTVTTTHTSYFRMHGKDKAQDKPNLFSVKHFNADTVT